MVRNNLQILKSKYFTNLPALRTLRLHSQKIKMTNIYFDAFENINENLTNLYVYFKSLCKNFCSIHLLYKNSKLYNGCTCVLVVHLYYMCVDCLCVLVVPLYYMGVGCTCVLSVHVCWMYMCVSCTCITRTCS